MERCSAALACKQLKGSHNFSAFAGALNDIVHREFNICDNIVCTTTDNGWIKAFPVYTQLDENDNEEPLEGARPSETAEVENSKEEEEGGNVVDLEVGC